MCGRYAITVSPEEYRAYFGYEETPNFPARYNVAPTQPVPIVHAERGRRHFHLVRWGFLPSWTKDPKSFPLVINARGESVSDKPTFKAAVKRRRCVFLAHGFYEWRRNDSAKQPFLMRMIDRGPMPLAGLWETYSDASGGEIDTAAIVTTDANGLLSGIHDRMPVILSRDDVAAWLDVDAGDDKEALRLIRPCADHWLDATPVSTRVNKVANDDAALQERVSASEGEIRAARRKGRLVDDAQGSLF